ncbi:MAG: hypothetical protein HDQ98_07255 [Lachnospiraceae bacterium]|nr:hypothetical protein [Lachnospiraceae bacterium]
MEKTLKRLLDFQKFSGNPRLAEMIAGTESRYDRALSDDDLEALNAAGELTPPESREEWPDD